MLSKPIFVVGHPRSGTSLARSLLERSPEVWTIGREGKPIWERWLHPSAHGWHSNHVAPEAAVPELVDKLRNALLAAARRPGAEWTVVDKLDFLEFMSAQGVDPFYYDVPEKDVRARFPVTPPEGPPTTRDGGELDEITPFCFPPRGPNPTRDELAGGIRVVEKSIQSCFRVEFLRKAFPDAKFVFVVRHPAASIASLMKAWLHPRMFFSYLVPETLNITNYSDVHPWGRSWWNLSLPPGWRDLVNLSLPEVCAENWRIHNEWVHRAWTALKDSGDAVLLRYEDLLDDPAEVMAQVAAAVELPYAKAWTEKELPVVMTQSAPDPNKWREHETEIRATFPRVAEVAAGFGYEVGERVPG